MMCSEMRELMLVADLDELAGVGPTPFAVHVRGCDRCRAMAHRIASGTSRFGTELALAAAAVPPRVTASRRRRARRGWLTGAVGLAAAACIAIVLTRQVDRWTPRVAPVLELAPNEDSAASTIADPIAEAAVVEPVPDLMLSLPLEQVSVDVPEGRRAVVMKTRNPSMTVVWLH